MIEIAQILQIAFDMTGMSCVQARNEIWKFIWVTPVLCLLLFFFFAIDTQTTLYHFWIGSK